MCDPRYEVCECDQAHFLREALERAYAEIVCDVSQADKIIKNALDVDHRATCAYIEGQS